MLGFRGPLMLFEVEGVCAGKFAGRDAWRPKPLEAASREVQSKLTRSRIYNPNRNIIKEMT